MPIVASGWTVMVLIHRTIIGSGRGDLTEDVEAAYCQRSCPREAARAQPTRCRAVLTYPRCNWLGYGRTPRYATGSVQFLPTGGVPLILRILVLATAVVVVAAVAACQSPEPTPSDEEIAGLACEVMFEEPHDLVATGTGHDGQNWRYEKSLSMEDSMRCRLACNRTARSPTSAR